MPQVGEAETKGWPKGYTERGVEATRQFFGEAMATSSLSGAIRRLLVTEHLHLDIYTMKGHPSPLIGVGGKTSGVAS